MAWVTVAMMGGSALLGMSKEQAAKKQQLQDNLAAAEQTRNSPWTNMGVGTIDRSQHSALGGAMAGAMAGGGMASNLAKSGIMKTAQAPVPEDQQLAQWQQMMAQQGRA